MSIGGLMRTSVSGMNAQANRLSAVSENIANSNTNGYKQTTTEFASQILANSPGQYNSGAVEVNVRTLVSEQGGLGYTANSTNSKKVDLAIQGNGFLVVGDGSGGNFLTRAGSFTQQADGSLVNAGGYTLMGYPVTASGTGYTVNSTSGMQEVNMRANLLSSSPTTKSELVVNLDKAEAAMPTADQTANLPSLGLGTAKPTSSRSITTYDQSGAQIKLDVYYTKIATGDPSLSPPTQDKWEVAVFNSKDAAKTGTTVPFPYTSGSLITKATLSFGADSKLASIMQAPATAATAVDVAKGDGVLKIDLTKFGGKEIALNVSETTQYTSKFEVLRGSANGNPAEVIDKISIGKDGVVTATFTSGTTRPLYQIPLAMVSAPDNMTAVSGNAWSPGVESGTVLIGFGGSGGFGDLISGALENSTVDLASELTTMIESQRSYTANSKVFQTGSEIMDVLVNLKR